MDGTMRGEQQVFVLPWLKLAPTMRSASVTSMVSPSKMAFFQMPSRVPQSSSVTTASILKQPRVS